MTATTAPPIGCPHSSPADAVVRIILEEQRAYAEGRPPRTPCPCCGSGVAVGGTAPCVVCLNPERERQRLAR